MSQVYLLPAALYNPLYGIVQVLGNENNILWCQTRHVLLATNIFVLMAR